MHPSVLQPGVDAVGSAKHAARHCSPSVTGNASCPSIKLRAPHPVLDPRKRPPLATLLQPGTSAHFPSEETMQSFRSKSLLFNITMRARPQERPRPLAATPCDSLALRSSADTEASPPLLRRWSATLSSMFSASVADLPSRFCFFLSRSMRSRGEVRAAARASTSAPFALRKSKVDSAQRSPGSPTHRKSRSTTHDTRCSRWPGIMLTKKRCSKAEVGLPSSFRLNTCSARPPSAAGDQVTTRSRCASKSAPATLSSSE